MTIWMPKKKPLYAPMLATFGGGSVKGFVSGGGSSQLEIDGVAFTSDGYVEYSSNSPKAITGDGVTIRLHLWGAAGGNGAYATGKNTGAGGYAYGTLTLTSSTYYLYIGQGGRGVAAQGYQGGGAGGWPNGGYGTNGDASGAGGGGMSMLTFASSFSTSINKNNIIMIAGGGGGTTGYSGDSGAGGGTSGQQAGGGTAGGATQTSGGINSGNSNCNGSYLQGGNGAGILGASSSQTDDGGGGGGGLYGGAGGTPDANPGAGGSGYLDTGILSNSGMNTGTNKFHQNGTTQNTSVIDPSRQTANAIIPLTAAAAGKTTNANSFNDHGNNGVAYIELL